MVLIIMGIVAVPLFILGLFMKQGKGLMLLAGYNTMPAAERAQIDKAMLSKVAGNLLLRISLEIVLTGVAGYLNLTWVMFAFIFISVADTLITTIKLSFRTKIARQGLSKPANKVVIIVTIAITALTFVLVGVMLVYGAKEPMVNIADGQIRIEGMYGMKIDFSDVKDIELIEKPMNGIDPKAHRDNGYGGGNTLKGHFSSKELGKYMLYVQANSSPTIKIERNGEKDIYISFKDGGKTETLYRELTAAMPAN